MTGGGGGCGGIGKNHYKNEICNNVNREKI